MIDTVLLSQVEGQDSNLLMRTTIKTQLCRQTTFFSQNLKELIVLFAEVCSTIVEYITSPSIYQQTYTQITFSCLLEIAQKSMVSKLFNQTQTFVNKMYNLSMKSSQLMHCNYKLTSYKTL